MEGELLNLRIGSAWTGQIIVAVHLPLYNINEYMWFKFMQKMLYMQEEIAYQTKTKEIWRYNNSPPCVMVKWCER